MINEYFTIEMLGTLGGMVLALMLIVQVTKSIIINSKYPDEYVRAYALIWSFVLQGVFIYIQHNVITADLVLLAFLNGLVVMAIATGIYEISSDLFGNKLSK